MFPSFLDRIARPPHSHWTVTHHEVIGEIRAQVEAIPSELHPRVTRLIEAAGIPSVYSHQAEAIRLSLAEKNVVLSTSTASGKTLAYQAVVMDRLLGDPDARALFLFPLKALERDQRDAFLAVAGDEGLTAAVYDGDTPEWERRKVRNRPPRVLISNPDMVHLGLLAYHDTWKEFFANLRYVILDEVHTYKGIFGSHISQVLLRLRRVCSLHGSHPRFFASSATIANPGEFVSRLIGEPVEVVDRSGAPASTRHFLFLQPVLSPYTIAARLFVDGLQSGLKTIVFTRARKITELITTWVLHEAPHFRNRISSYRAGFLPEERREIEAKLFSGAMDGVITTSALEMGIDVGGLDLCILVGYPGTVINTWQRSGRVGRSGRPSAIILIGSNDALDQYFLKNPKDFFGRSCEQAVLDPLNKEVLRLHLPCAAAEAPLRQDEAWVSQEEVQSVLADLEKDGVMYRGHEDDAWYSYRKRPHRDVDLRGIGAAFSIFLADGKIPPNPPLQRGEQVSAALQPHFQKAEQQSATLHQPLQRGEQQSGALQPPLQRGEQQGPTLNPPLERREQQSAPLHPPLQREEQLSAPLQPPLQRGEQQSAPLHAPFLKSSLTASIRIWSIPQQRATLHPPFLKGGQGGFLRGRAGPCWEAHQGYVP